MKIKAWLKAFFAKENLSAKASSGDFTPEELVKINAACKEQFGTDFAATLDAMAIEENEVTALQDNHRALLATISAPNAAAASAAAATAEPNTPAAAAAAAVVAQQQTIADLTAQNAALAAQSEPAQPARIIGKLNIIPITGGEHTKTHALGIAHDFFATSKPWNAVMATGKPLEVIASTLGLKDDWKKYEQDIKAEFNSYGEQLADRISKLQANGTLSKISMQGIDFTGFDNADLTGYVVRRQDAIIAYVRSFDDVTGLFPVSYGVQDKEELTNAFLTNFSSGWLAGRYFKGSSKVEPIFAQVSDVMIKHKFSDLKKLERQYIGYLNTESSDPMKWGWIEWMFVNILKQAVNEQNERRIRGLAIAPKTDAYNHHLHGSTGVMQTLLKWSGEFRLQPITGHTYTKSTILATVEDIAEFLNSKLPSLSGIRIGINKKHLPWYNSAYATQYALRQDYTGVKAKVMNYEELEVVGVPHMGSSCMIIVSIPGNIRFIENKSGEMQSLYTQRDLEELMVVSQWKEGTTAFMVGKKFANATDLAADDYQSQYIFFTDDTIDLAANATTCDATKGFRFKTIANSGATALTDFVGAKPGDIYRLTIGSATNATTIAKSGKFSAITAAFSPSAVGDYLEVYLYRNPDDSTDALNGKFIEVARKVTV